MTDIETLQECRWAVMEERALSRQIDRLAMIGGPRGIGSQAIRPAADRKTNNETAGQMQLLEGLINRLTKRREENLRIIEQAETTVERIKDRKDRVVIRLYYVEGESDYEIAREIEKSQGWVQQRRNSIMDGLAMRRKK